MSSKMSAKRLNKVALRQGFSNFNINFKDKINDLRNQIEETILYYNYLV